MWVLLLQMGCLRSRSASVRAGRQSVGLDCPLLTIWRWCIRNAAELPYLSTSHLVSLPVRTVLYGIEYILAVKSNDQADIEI